MQVNIENKLCCKNTTNYIKSLKNGAGEAIQTLCNGLDLTWLVKKYNLDQCQKGCPDLCTTWGI